MVADLTRYSACKVHPDTPDKPIAEQKAVPAAEAEKPRIEKADPTGDEPMRLFVWASA
ncbi:MAG TPA: hypothetical protein VF503_05750 [Sphingobium sp.]|uniref:hypothetical protein n=1 Tax=Sphingobium sp. TaxID=1912891 RepID=UPI002ED33306